MIFYMETRAQERTMKMKVEGSLDPKGRMHRLIEEARQGSEEGETWRLRLSRLSWDLRK